jgi:hypothetical protein
LLRSGFLPDHHLELDPGGAWRFNDAAPPAIRELMAGYFASRREDGVQSASGQTDDPAEPSMRQDAGSANVGAGKVPPQQGDG